MSSTGKKETRSLLDPADELREGEREREDKSVCGEKTGVAVVIAEGRVRKCNFPIPDFAAEIILRTHGVQRRDRSLKENDS